MELRLAIGGAAVTISTEDRKVPGTLRAKVGDRELEARVLAVEADVVHLVLDGVRRRVVVLPGPEGCWTFAAGRARLVEDAGRRRASAGAAEEAGVVTPPFPATVVAVHVAVGDLVERGQALVVLSAMKTEMTLAAPRAGRVTVVRAELGATTAPGDVLVEIEETDG